MSNLKRGTNQYKTKKKSNLQEFAKGVVKAFVWLFIIFVGVGSGLHYYEQHLLVKVAHADASQEVTVDKVEELKDKVVGDVASKCETKGKGEDDAVIIFDSNKKASIGEFQFQITTVQHYYKVLYKEDITRKEAVLIALDHDKALQLAKAIMFETKGKASGDWTNCARKLGTDAQIDLIKSIK